MTYEAWITLAVTGGIFISLVMNWGTPDILFVGATAALALLGIISTTEATAGFANSGVLTVGAMFVVAAALRETGVLDLLGQKVLGGVSTTSKAFGRLAVLVLPLSAFLNNTPIVAMLVPMVMEWCRRQRVSPSKLLIPLSYLAILGGTCTLIGTSTNLVVHGLMIESHAQYEKGKELPGVPPEKRERFVDGLRDVGLFELGKIGVPYAIIGVAYMYLFGIRMLPDRKELIEQLGESRREYLAEMLVMPDCRLIGQTIEAAGLRHLPGLFLIEIDRDGTTIGPVGPEEVIRANDRFIFTGIVSSIVELEKIPGLVPAADPTYQVSPKRQRNRQLCEAVVSETSPLVGRSVREADFRATYNAAVVAVHRNGHRVTNKVGDIELRPGDTLLLQTRTHFMRAQRNNPDFHLVSDVEDWRPLRRDRAWIATGLFLGLIVVMTATGISVAIAALMAAVLMIAADCISSGEARRSIEWQVLITIASSFGVGSAIENSGLATTIAQGLVNFTEPFGPLAALACFYLLGSLMTEVITNNAAAVLLFPFCLETARLFGTSPRPFLMALILAASASFITPIGYQTNMMVYGPGGYRFSDFVRVGAPLNLVLWLVATLLIPWFWPF